uniref:Uncharacterized protein n=1 Tax=Triticum urartu TaxID=4572 RepID=A0A8R7QVV1_TRIUA
RKSDLHVRLARFDPYRARKSDLHVRLARSPALPGHARVENGAMARDQGSFIQTTRIGQEKVAHGVVEGKK